MVIIAVAMMSMSCMKPDPDQGNVAAHIELEYLYQDSWQCDYRLEKDYVVFKENICIKNNSGQEIRFKMMADYGNDSLLADRYLMAYQKDTMNEKVFVIKGKSKQNYIVYFKGRKGAGGEKGNRLPPESIELMIQ